MEKRGLQKPDEGNVIGWRARLGVIVLSPNLTVEYEFPRMAPEGVTFHVARCQISDQARTFQEKEAELLRGDDDLQHASLQVAMARPDLILFACTVASFLGEEGRPAEVSQKITQATGIPSLTTTQAVLEAIQALGMKRIVLISPYLEEVGRKEKIFLEKNLPGLKVVAMHHLGIMSAFEKNLLSPSSAYRVARETWVEGADGLFISCASWRTMEILSLLEGDLQAPVVSSAQASLWACLRRCRIKGSDRFGRLFQCS
ncbi:MAG: aspartate/glutamate racemase family protein [Deltaproteobacteria bacterium]|nr:aspartate/glutamate racemase family protein [Deltaproteobacteria bacterium]